MAEFKSGKKGINTKDSVKANHHAAPDKVNIGGILQMANMNPDWLTARDVARLQRTIGNEAVTQLFESQPVQAMGVIQAVGYTPEQLAKILETIPGVEQGVCNALAAAWLSGQLEAEGRTLGVTPENLNMIVALKKLLNLTVNSQYQLDSRDITWAFLQYFQAKGEGWLRGVAEKGYGDIFDEAQAFTHWIFARRGGYEPSKKMVERTVNGLYKVELNQETISEKIDEALEEHFNLGTPFRGIVTLKVKNTQDSEIHFGHEIAIRHMVSENRENNHFIIYDQNGGVQDERITSDADISLMLAEYLNENYINNPVSNTDSAEINIMIDFGG